MDQTMEMGRSAGMGQGPGMAKEKMMMMKKEQMKAMIDGMGEEQLTAMGAMMDEINKPADVENPEGESTDTSLDWNEDKASVDRKLSKMGM